MTDKKDPNATKVLTPEFRVSFPHVFAPHTGFEGQAAKYSLVMLFDHKTDISKLKQAAFKAAVDKWGPKEKWPKALRMPFRDGNEKSDLQGYENTIYVTANSPKQRPQVINAKKEPITEEDGAFYPGCYARATLRAFAYDKAGNKGVSFSLQNVQKIRDGESFGGRKNAVDEFDEVDDGSDEKSSYDDSGDDASMGF